MSAITHFERIESYVEGNMPAVEQQAFEKELEANTLLKEEYEAYLATLSIIDELAYEKMREKVASLQNKKEARRYPINRRVLAWAAAILLLLVSGSFWYAGQNYSDQALFVAFYEAPDIGGTRSISDPTTVDDQANPSLPDRQGFLDSDPTILYDQGVRAYFDQDPGSAVNLLSGIAPDAPLYPNAQYFLGHIYLASQQTNKAIDTFQALLALRDNRFTENVEWSLILAHLQLGKMEEVNSRLKTILSQPDHPYLEEARSLNRKLNSFWRRLGAK